MTANYIEECLHEIAKTKNKICEILGINYKYQIQILKETKLNDRPNKKKSKRSKV